MLACAAMKTPLQAAPVVARPLAPIGYLFVVAILAHTMLVGCGGGAKQDESSTQTQTPPPAQTTDTSSSAAAGGGDLGATVYAARCALCHGPGGHGDGPAAAGLNPKPRNHTDGSYMNGRTDDELLTVIRNGKGAMPAWGKILSDAEIHAVLKHVRSLAVPPYVAK